LFYDRLPSVNLGIIIIQLENKGHIDVKFLIEIVFALQVFYNKMQKRDTMPFRLFYKNDLFKAFTLRFSASTSILSVFIGEFSLETLMSFI